MKKFKKTAAFLMIAAVLISLMPSVEAQAKEDLTITANIDKNVEIPLTLDASTDEFYVKYNLNPGDVMTSDVVFKNISNEPIQVRIADVTDQLNTTLTSKLLSILDLEIEVDGAPVYKGKHDKVTTPLTQWITLDGGKEMTMKIRVEFSKYEADNTFQGAEMKIKYSFEARADVPMDEELPETSAAPKAPDAPKNPETIKTGVDDMTSNRIIGYVSLAGACIGIFVLYFVTRKNKKEE